MPRVVWRALRRRCGAALGAQRCGTRTEWWRVRTGEARVVVGTRSAIFAPLENLGLVIVDEEQENSYKQEETPRYHGRDVAIVRAKLENALALLGSATPSLETYHHAVNGKYELLTMASRVENRNAGRRGDRGPAQRFPANAKGQPHFANAARRNRRMPPVSDAGARSDQSARLFLVSALPQLRRFRAVRELQHLHDLSQKPQSAGMPLLRLYSAGAESLPKVRIEICVFFWRRLRASGRTPAKGISRRAHRPPGSRHRAHQAAISGNARRIRRAARWIFSWARKCSPKDTISSASRWSA